MEIPAFIRQHFANQLSLLEYLQSLPTSHQREYITWILEAKKEETRTKRLIKMEQMLQEKSGYSKQYV